MKRSTNKTIHIILTLLPLILLLPAVPHAFFGGKIDNFSADQVMTSKDGRELSSSKIYISPEAMRMDGMPMGKGQPPGMISKNISTITFISPPEYYMLNHDKKLIYHDTDLARMGQDLAGRFEEAKVVKVLGTETISGYKCTKKVVKNDMEMSSDDTITIWVNDRFEMPLKVELPDGGSSEMKNIKKNDADKKRFELPGDYKKVNNIMAVMGFNFNYGQMDDVDMGNEASRAGASQKAEQQSDGSFKMPDINGADMEKALKDLGNQLKNFKFDQE